MTIKNAKCPNPECGAMLTVPLDSSEEQQYDSGESVSVRCGPCGEWLKIKRNAGEAFNQIRRTCPSCAATLTVTLGPDDQQRFARGEGITVASCALCGKGFTTGPVAAEQAALAEHFAQ